MIALQKPPPHVFAAPLFRPTHSRAPSAPVVVRPTHTPGLLSLSKPAQPAPRPQTVQQQRQQRSSPRGKPQRSPPAVPALAQASDDVKLLSGLVPKADSPASGKASEMANPPAQLIGAANNADKPLRGRQANKAAKEKARRSASSSSRAPARRPSHQPSPSPNTRIPSQAEVTTKRSPKSHPIVNATVSDPNDPFVDTEPTKRDSNAQQPGKTGHKGLAFRTPPSLAQPSGKLARRRQQNARAPPTPTVPKSAQRKERVAALVGTVDDKTSLFETPVPRRRGRNITVTDWDSFPICDDSADQMDDSDNSPPTTPIRETASVPPRRATKAWIPTDRFDDVPRTAPLSSTFGFPFVAPNPSSTPTPAQRRRNHRRVPSEGVFHMSADEDSSSDVFSSYNRAPAAGSRRRLSTELPRARNDVIGGTASSAPQVGYFAGSIFQSSPSPEELPPPSF